MGAAGKKTKDPHVWVSQRKVKYMQQWKEKLFFNIHLKWVFMAIWKL